MDTIAVHQNKDKGLLNSASRTSQKKKVILVLILMFLTLVGCRRDNKSTPTTTIAITMLPPTITPSITVSPTNPAILTPTITTSPTFTPLPEDTIVLNWGYSVVPPDPESKTIGDNWAHDLSTVSGLNVVALPGPSTNMEILEALRDDKIHMAELDALTYSYGQSHGWIVPGLVVKHTSRPSGNIMFVVRTDTGLVKGDTPEVLQQLVGKRPCWPDINQGWWYGRPPIYEYLLPTGLLSQAGVELGRPVFVTYTNAHKDNTTQVFLGECDFAVVEAMPENYFLMQWSPYLGSKGATITDWKTQMQVLYTTPPLEPSSIMAFSSQLDPSKRNLLIEALLGVPDYSTEALWVPFDAEQAAFYDQFQDLVDASGVIVADYLSRVWDLWLRNIIEPVPTPSPLQALPNPDI